MESGLPQCLISSKWHHIAEMIINFLQLSKVKPTQSAVHKQSSKNFYVLYEPFLGTFWEGLDFFDNLMGPSKWLKKLLSC